MRKEVVAFAIIVSLVSCTGKSSQKSFEINGTITNNRAKMIYLEEIPVATMRPLIVDSALLQKDGKYVLKTKSKEATVYSLRLDRSIYPLASVINDTSVVTVNATLNADNNLFSENYEVKGSIASKQMKDFMFVFNNKLQSIFYISLRADSLQKKGEADSIALQEERLKIETDLKYLTLQSINASENAALTMFELSYYQISANNPVYKIQALDNDEVIKIVNDAAIKFPSHKGIEMVRASLEAEVNAQMNAQIQKPSGLVGKEAPEISLPDLNGKEIKLSSYKGKYVMVDFWASWCSPCRRESPNLVSAYNKYKDKNFTILSVSVDEEKDEWKKAIREDGLLWTQVNGPKYFNSNDVPAYNFEAIPYNVLVDPSGTIIAENLRGPLLEAKLAEVIK